MTQLHDPPVLSSLQSERMVFFNNSERVPGIHTARLCISSNSNLVALSSTLSFQGLDVRSHFPHCYQFQPRRAFVYCTNLFRQFQRTDPCTLLHRVFRLLGSERAAKVTSTKGWDKRLWEIREWVSGDVVYTVEGK